MMDKKKTVLIHCDDLEQQLNYLTDEESGQLLRLIVDYVCNDVAPEVENRVVGMAFQTIRQQVDRETERYKAKCEKNRKTKQEYWDRIKAKQTNTNEYERIQPNSEPYPQRDPQPYPQREEIKDSCNNSNTEEPTTDEDNYLKFMDWYNESVKNTTLSKIVSMTSRRKAALDALKDEFGGPKIVEALEKAKMSNYLLGYSESANGRRMSVDWFLNNDNVRKILEGVYDND